MSLAPVANQVAIRMFDYQNLRLCPTGKEFKLDIMMTSAISESLLITDFTEYHFKPMGAILEHSAVSLKNDNR